MFPFLDQAILSFTPKILHQLYPLRTVNLHHQSLKWKTPLSNRATARYQNPNIYKLVDHSFTFVSS